MKILLLGGYGQVGSELRGPLASIGELVVPPRATLDLGDLDALARTLRDVAPNVVINCAAYNAVDDAEKDIEGALRINRDVVALLGERARAQRFGLITYSTDFVFDGALDRPYREGDAPNPLSNYGTSKLEGERALLAIDAPALTFRTAWVWSAAGRSFVSLMLKLAREKRELRVVDDQIGNPTFARDLAFATAAIVYAARRDPHAAIHDARGVYHLAGSEACSRYELAREAIARDPRRSEHVVRQLTPVPSSAFPTPARRPARAALDGSLVRERFGLVLPGYRDALSRALTT